MPTFLVLLILCGALVAGFPGDAQAQKGKNAFTTVFKEAATGRNDGNAYLLIYLSTVIYPEMLDQISGPKGSRENEVDYVRKLHGNPRFFETEYARATSYLFHDAARPPSATNAAPQYRFLNATNQGGYDPEAMVISTPEAVFVVFRGTDRVASARTDTGYGALEWLQTDFFLLGLRPDPPEFSLPGKVHAGFWESLKARTARGIGFREDLFQQIVAFGGRSKKVWITGHSLGAAHAQAYAAYLYAHVDKDGKRDGIWAQGVYGWAAPHPGDKDFAAALDRMFPDRRLQRFDFVDDPVTMLPLYAMGYARAGTRIYYDDVKTIKFDDPERIQLEAAKLAPALAGQLGDVTSGWINDRQKVLKFRGTSALFCYHYPQWYLAAAYHQLSRVEKARAPLPIRRPDTSDFYKPCGPDVVARGLRNPVAAALEQAKEAGEAIQDAIETVSYNAKQIFDNVSGTAIAEGTYFIRAVKGGKYLDVSGGCVGQDGCKVQLWDLGRSASNNKFTVRKYLGGYIIKAGDKFVEVDADDLFDNGAQVQTWGANALGGNHAPNQIWLFFRVKDNKYILRNLASLKVLDATDSCTSQNGCRVKQWSAHDSDPSQVWIVEKAS